MNISSSSHRIAIVAFSVISRDARVLRQIEYLSPNYEVSVIGYGSLPASINCEMFALDDPVTVRAASLLYRVRFFSERLVRFTQLILGRIFPAKMYEAWYWNRKDVCQSFDRLLRIKPQIIHANDWITLPLAVRAAKQLDAIVVADLHEYAPLEKEGIIWRLFLQPLREYVLRQYIKFTSATITVNNTIANRYKDEFGFDPIVVMNAPVLDQSVNFRPTDPNSIQLIHHGGLGSDRKPDLMLQTIALCDIRYHLNFMLVGDSKSIGDFEKKASQIAPDRVTFHQPVTPKKVVSRISQFDIGFYLLPRTNYNNWVATPNKFFDFIHAGLAICIGPSPEMKRICGDFGCGVSANSFEPEDCAKVLNDLTPLEIDWMKQASLAARLEVNADKEFSKLLDLYKNLTKEF